MLRLPLLLLLLLPGRPPSADPLDPDDVPEPPAVGRPANFSGAIGSFRIAAAAEPTRLHAEDPLTYTLTVTAQGRALRPPERPRLEDLTAFSRSFLVEPLPEDPAPPPAAGIRRFAYRLRPRSPEVTAIPGFPFVYYKPGVLPPSRGYQTAYVPEIALEVTPRPSSLPVPPAPSLPEPPALAHHIARGPAVLHDNASRFIPAPWMLALLLLAPPAFFLAWFLVARRHWPARTARARQSRLAREALAALKSPRGRPAIRAQDEPERIASVLRSYLASRFALTSAEPSAQEAADALRRAGVAEPGIQQLAGLLHALGAARFAPNGQPSPSLAAQARETILALEAAA